MPLQSILYSLPYLFLAASFITMFAMERCLEPSNRRYCEWLCFILYVCFFGFRGFIGSDWALYYRYFEGIDPFSPSYNLDCEAGDFADVGFVFLTYFLKGICDNYNFYVFVMTLADAVMLHYLFRRYSTSVALSYFLFVTVDILMQIDHMRNFKAVLLCLIALDYLIRRHFIGYCLLVSLAALFHRSVLLFLPLYFILGREGWRWCYVLIFVLANIFYFTRFNFGEALVSAASVFSESKSDAYLAEQFATRAGISISYLIRAIPIASCLVWFDVLKAKNKYFVVFLNLLMLSFVVNSVCTDSPEFMARIMCLFAVGLWIIVPQLLNTCRIPLQYRFCILSLFLCYGAMRVVSLTGNVTYNYGSFWGEVYDGDLNVDIPLEIRDAYYAELGVL